MFGEGFHRQQLPPSLSKDLRRQIAQIHNAASPNQSPGITAGQVIQSIRSARASSSRMYSLYIHYI
jgi:hypothetical protein